LNQVTPVKDQKQCGSCWTFSTTAAVEHQYLKLTGQVKDGAEQQLVDCAQSTNGCNGGDPGAALAYIQNKGSPPEATVPYTASYTVS
jgi:C1A family cysteine protease